jgi:hypothetical protein
MSKRLADRGAALGILATLVCVALTALSGLSVVVSALGASALVCILPGHAYLLAWYPWLRFGLAPLAALSIGLSLSIVALSALVLNWTGTGLSRDGWIVALGGWSSLLYLGAMLRRADIVPVDWRGAAGTRVVLATGAILACGFVAALSIAQYGARHQRRPDFLAVGIKMSGSQSCLVTVANRSATQRQAMLYVRQGHRTLIRRRLDLGRNSSTAIPVRVGARRTPDRVVAEIRGMHGRLLRSVELPGAT